jgi:hypothetical protein
MFPYPAALNGLLKQDNNVLIHEQRIGGKARIAPHRPAAEQPLVRCSGRHDVLTPTSAIVMRLLSLSYAAH